MAHTDMTFLQSFTGGNADKMKKYISMFIGYAPGQIQTMKSQLSEGNYDGLRGTAHALKPQITYMGIKEGEPMIKEIEHKAGSKTDVETLPDLMNRFETVCNSAIEELKAHIA